MRLTGRGSRIVCRGCGFDVAGGKLFLREIQVI